MLKVKFVADQTVPRITDVFKKPSKNSGLKIKIVDDSNIDVMQDMKDLTLVSSKVRTFKYFVIPGKAISQKITLIFLPFLKTQKFVKTQRLCTA